MKTWIVLFALGLSGVASAASAADAPFTPPPATGVLNPLTGDRDSAPSASPATTGDMGCRGPGTGIVMMNGAPTPTSPPPAGRSIQGVEPKMVNGGPMPAAVPTDGDPAWCGGAYSPSSGTNFGGTP